MKFNNLLLVIILVIGIFFRFWNLGQTPPSLYWDEASQGYNSYSILKTGYDEHHEFLPIARFIAFGDYKAPVYIYADVPFIALFGLTSFAIRFPSAFFGSLTILVTYFLALELFSRNRDKQKIALVASFLLAISPWHIQLSRAAYEANIATFFTVLGVYLFLYSRKKKWYLLLSAIFLVIAFYSFNAHRIFIPLLIMLLGAIFYRNFLAYKKIVLFSIVIGIIMLLPFITYLRSTESRLRFTEVNIFSDLNVIKQSNQWILEDNNSLLSHFVHNRRVLFTFVYVKHYLDFFNPSYLFFTGDGNPRFSVQDFGELYLWELPLILVGVYQLVKMKNKTSLAVLGWFLLAPVAAATARETPHALRSETYIPTYEIIAAIGAVWLFHFNNRFRTIYKKSVLGLCVLMITFSLYTFFHSYFVHYSILFSTEWQYGYKQAVEISENLKKDYDIISFTQTYGRPYIYVLLYGNVVPQQYWEKGKVMRDILGFYNVTGYEKYSFRDNLVKSSDIGKKVLYVGTVSQIPKSARVIQTINFLNGEPAFIIASNT